MKVSVRKAQGKQSNQTWLSLINNFVYNFLFLHVIYIEDIKTYCHCTNNEVFY